jgi:hypothetical protein
MFMLAFNPADNPLNNNEWSFPLLEIIHIAGFTLSIGTVALVDLRMLGLAMLRLPSSQVARDMAPWTLAGLAIMLTTGPMIFSSDPNMYLANASFRFKICALLIAIIYNYTIHRKVALDPTSSPSVGKLVAAVSLVLWVSVVAGGLSIAFV